MSIKSLVCILIPLSLSACSTNSVEPPRNNAELEEKCQELKDKIRDLKGRPIRRTGASSQYELECTLPNHDLNM